MTDHHRAGSRTELLHWMFDGTRRFESAIDGLDDTELLAASALDGWTRAHLASHVARNADALGNLLAWARTGVETPMYVDPDARFAAIDAGAARTPAAIRSDLVEADARLAAVLDAMPEPAWEREVRSARGRAITAAEVPWLRIREVWVHLVDLGTGLTFDALPTPIVDALIDDATAWMGRRDGTPHVELVATDRERRWVITGSGGRCDVSGTAGDLAAWVLGRAGPDRLVTSTGDVPALPVWL